MLGRVWHKKIDGVNPSCKVDIMDFKEIVQFLSEQNPGDILCLGARTGDMAETLNKLERKYPDKYNKRTIFASIRDKDDANGQVDPGPDSGIFTTFDSSKGLERKICVVFDFTESYWTVRSRKPNQKYEILRNIFCVAASRGKDHIIFVHKDEELLSEDMLSTPTESNPVLEDMSISQMFDFKYKEDVEDCFFCLECERIENTGDNSIIDVNTADGLIDLSPYIGIYQEQCFFKGYDLEKELDLIYQLDQDRAKMYQREFYTGSSQKKILILTALETHLNRYIDQVETPFVTDEETDAIKERLSTVFSSKDEVQKGCSITFKYGHGETFDALGLIDVFKDNTVYELKFTSALTHEHFLQCACYIAATDAEKGILWNTRDNAMYEIRIRDKDKFLNTVAKTITKGEFNARWSVKKFEKKKIAKPKK